MKKWLYLLSLIVFSIILTGCGESEAKADLSEYPEIVQNGEVSPEFYDEIDSFINEYEDVWEGVLDIAESEEISPDVIFEEVYVDAVIELKEMTDKVEGFIELKPNSEKEITINKMVMNTVETQNSYNEKLWDKAKNGKREDETDLWVSRSMLEAVFEQLKEEIEYVE